MNSKLTLPGYNYGASLIAQLGKNPPAMQETLIQFLGQEDPQEKEYNYGLPLYSHGCPSMYWIPCWREFIYMRGNSLATFPLQQGSNRQHLWPEAWDLTSFWAPNMMQGRPRVTTKPVLRAIPGRTALTVRESLLRCLWRNLTPFLSDGGSVTKLHPTRNPMDCCPPGYSVHGDFPGKNTGVGCHFLLQGIFPTQRLNLCLLHCRWIPYHVNHHGHLS